MCTEPLCICEKTKPFVPHLPQRETDQVLEASGACVSGCAGSLKDFLWSPTSNCPLSLVSSAHRSYLGTL